MARTGVPGMLDMRVTVQAEADFLTTDPYAWYLLIYSGGHKGDKVRVEWHNPQGEAVQQNDWTQMTDGEVMRLEWKMPIAGAPASFAPGDWTVRLLVNDHSVSVTPFRISAPPASIVNIVSKTLLPAGAVTVPYYFQLTARGGTPPYKWMAVDPFPPGLTLSPTGTISGAPEQRGSYRATVEARDSAGNSVVRSLGVGIGVRAVERRAGAPILVKSASDACSQTASQTDFSGSDATVVMGASVVAPKRSKGRVEWLNPRGEISLVSPYTKRVDGPECIVKLLPVAGHPPATDPGDWRVRLLWQEAEAFTLKFSISAAKGVSAANGAGDGKSTAGGKNAVAARSGRVAVVIGNLGYEKLPAPGPSAADLDLVESALREDGFEVVRQANVNLENLRLIERTLGDTQAGDTVVVYYAGYGIRTGGDDWWLPVNYDPGDSRAIQSKAYSVLRLLQVLEDSKATLKFIVLDEAAVAGQPRENPGAVMGEVDEVTALVYSSPPAASPKPGTPGPAIFPRAFAEVLRKPGLDAGSVLQIELPKAVARLSPSGPAPVAFIGGGADFVFRVAPPAK